MDGEKYVIKFTDGCTVTGLDINDTDYKDVPLCELKKIAKKLIDNMDTGSIGTFLMNYAETNAPGDYLYTCDECGDSIYEYKIEI